MLGFLITFPIRGFIWLIKPLWGDEPLKEKIKSFVFAVMWGWSIFLIIRASVGLVLLKTNGVRTKALVTSTVVSLIRWGDPRYVYVFKYNGEEYTGNSLIEEKDYQRVGDSIEIVYLKYWPSMNRPVDSFTPKFSLKW